MRTWYYRQHATIFQNWKISVDGSGNGLLDFTVVPFVTEVEDCGSAWQDMAAMIIGDKKLGFVHDVFYKASTAIDINRFWGTVGQAFGYRSTAPAGAPIDGLWAPPA